MAEPGIEIRWGDGFEKPKQRDVVRENLKNAISMALAGLVDMGIPIESNKRMVVHRVKKVAAGNADTIYGMTSTAKTFHINIPDEVKWRTQRTCTLADACCILHELVHTRRKEIEPNSTLMEYAATEGLAYNAEYTFRRDVAPWYRIKGVVAKTAQLSREELTTIRYPFIATATRELTEGKSAPDEVYDEWLTNVHMFALSKAEIVGVDSVTRRLRAGEGLASLIAMPAAEILRVA